MEKNTWKTQLTECMYRKTEGHSLLRRLCTIQESKEEQGESWELLKCAYSKSLRDSQLSRGHRGGLEPSFLPV